MAIFIHIARAFALLRCCFSSSYRTRVCERWKKTPQHRVIFEIGTGVVGLIVVGARIAVIIVSSRK